MVRSVVQWGVVVWPTAEVHGHVRATVIEKLPQQVRVFEPFYCAMQGTVAILIHSVHVMTDNYIRQVIAGVSGMRFLFPLAKEKFKASAHDMSIAWQTQSEQ